jgi:hypothetical protein
MTAARLELIEIDAAFSAKEVTIRVTAKPRRA